MSGSRIILCNDLEYAKNRVPEALDAPIVKTFFEEEFKVEHAHAVTREAYIAEERTKAIVLGALSYNIYAQNALLKLLEEPPRNILFVILTRSKNALLPTVRSRMQIEVLEAPAVETELELDLAHLDLDSIFTFLKKHSNSSKDELKTLIQLLLTRSINDAGIRLSARELSLFDTALELAEYNTRAQNILSLLLLTLYEAKMRRR
ncbi:MAG TPA: DNA polymerase III subunit delta' [Campylobacteraceae bacterium]|jgi:DNA polymerase-3 subunit delta'|nr:DNA polymerase III subunit delta' [Campylobacteraceae bacterium]